MKHRHAWQAYEFAREFEIKPLGVRVPSQAYFKSYLSWCRRKHFEATSASLFWKVFQDHFKGRIDKRVAVDPKSKARKTFVFNLAPKGQPDE